MSTESILEMKGVSMAYGQRTLFKNFTLDLHTNEIVGISGESGSGKSTLLRIAVDLATPDEGEVVFQGRNVQDWDPQQLRKCIILVPQQASMFPGTVRENLLWGLKIHNQEASEEELVSILKEVNLNGEYLDRVAENLSGGEKQRVAIARALLLEPCGLLLDEPTSALDEKSTLAVEKTVKGLLKSRDIGVLVVTHNREQAERLTDRVIEITTGEEVNYNAN